MQTLSKHFILCCSILFCTAFIKGQDVVLDVPPIGQERRTWCWAACMQMILDYHGHTTSQADLVSEFLTINGTSFNPSDLKNNFCLIDSSFPNHTLGYANRNGSPEEYQYADIIFNRNRFFSVQSQYTDLLSLRDIQSELTLCQPFMLFLERIDRVPNTPIRFEHAIVVKGLYEHEHTDENYLLGNDPYNVPRCVGCEVLHPMRILDDPTSFPYSAVHSVRQIFPMDREPCINCEDQIINASSPLLMKLADIENRYILDTVRNGTITSAFYNHLISLGYQDHLPIQFTQHSLSGSSQVEVKVITSSTLAYYFYQDPNSNKLLLRRIVDVNCTPFDAATIALVPIDGNSSIIFKRGSFGITEILPYGDQFYRVTYQKETFLSPLYSNPDMDFKVGVMYPESQIRRAYSRITSDQEQEYIQELRDEFRQIRKSLRKGFKSKIQN